MQNGSEQESTAPASISGHAFEALLRETEQAAGLAEVLVHEMRDIVEGGAEHSAQKAVAEVLAGLLDKLVCRLKGYPEE